MSYLTSPYSVRLQDLKLWQGNYDNLIKTKSNDSTRALDFCTAKGLSTSDGIPSSPSHSPFRKHVDWDKKAITPTKPFEQLLEEKLAEDIPTQVQIKPKKPYLKKGSGLIRYRLTPRSANVRLSRKKTLTGVKSEGRIQKSEETLQQHKNCFNKSVPNGDGVELCITPLKVPDLCIEPKATWSKYLEEDETRTEAAMRTTVETELAPGVRVTPRDVFNSHLFGKINELALKHFMPESPRKSVRVSLNNNFTEYTKLNNDNLVQTDPLSGNTTDKELHIFEALEERAENSSFSSTNSSIIRLLSSTPNKVKVNPIKSPILEEKTEEVKCYADNRTLDQKLLEMNRKTDVLNDFLKNLRKISSDEHDPISEKPTLEETSYSEEEKWSGITDTRSQSPSSFYTDFENTFKGATKVDIAVNTSFKETEESGVQSEGCLNCKELRRKLSRLSKEVPDIQAEKARVCDFAKDLEKKRDQLCKEIQKLKEKYEEDVADLREELEGEKKKFLREKAVFDMYIKESQNRPTKKEREEIASLKKELADVKELLKLKDTKNGATQARLRNTIKQLEKEQTELKGTVDGLQKENAKLRAAQKVRRPSDSKMLQEINKNLSKLTEETFKKQLNKSESELNRERRKSTGKISENGEISPKIVKRQPSNLKIKSSHDSNAVDDNATYESTIASFCIEKQYENAFKEASDLEPQNGTMNDSRKGNKTEKVYPDGSKETKYSNGNSKTVSPDGNLISVRYYNGDIKETNLTEHTIKYYYAETETWHTQYGDGSELLEFPNGQQERKYKDGRKEVICPDGPSLTKMPDGSEEVVYPDGSKILKSTNGEKVLILPNGQKEIHTNEHKRREYPDGTVKIVYPDGTQETRYASGRLRIRDANGVLIVDSQES